MGKLLRGGNLQRLDLDRSAVGTHGGDLLTGVGRRNVQRHHVHVCDLHGAGVLVAVEQDLLIIGGGLGFASVTGLTSPHGIDTTHDTELR